MRPIIFSFIFHDEKLENDFLDFFPRYNLMSLFANEHRAGDITVRYTDARSIVNAGSGGEVDDSGAHHSRFKNYAERLTIANDNIRYDDAQLKMLLYSDTFQKLSNNVKRANELWESLTDPDDIKNYWNIVYYHDDVIR